jgi:hypothetical protein
MISHRCLDRNRQELFRLNFTRLSADFVGAHEWVIC